MGLVFLAEQVGVGNKLAIKFLDPAPNNDESHIARFLREAKVGLLVQHPGAVQILDLGRDESLRLFLCFELADGEDLRAILNREGRIRFSEARSIAIQVAQVLAFAHDKGIVHRDVKPENIRIRRDIAGPHVKVLDFGIARLVKETGLRLTGEGMMTGTPRYMAPEHIRDEPIDGRVDQYALGLMFFEMLTGAAGTQGKNVAQILKHQLESPVPPLGSVDSALRNSVVDAFIAQACAKTRALRFANMTEFIVALQRLELDEKTWPEPARLAIPTNTGVSPHSAPTVDQLGQVVTRPEFLADTVASQLRTDPVPENKKPRPRWLGLLSVMLALTLLSLWWWFTKA